MAKVHFQLPNQDCLLTLTCQPVENGYEFTWQSADGMSETRTLSVESPQSGQGWLEQNGHIQPFYYHREKTTEKDILHLWLAGQTYLLPLADLRPQRGTGGKGGPASGDIKAPMPGTVLQIKVTKGETVEAGQAIIIMESMKMEMTLAAPGAGWVADIHCQEGQLVEMGTLLASLEAVAENNADESKIPAKTS